MTNAARSTPTATAALEALLARRCQDLLAAASSWLDAPDDGALAGAAELLCLLRARASLTAHAPDSFDGYVERLVDLSRPFARTRRSSGTTTEAVCYGHLRARSAGLRTQGDIALWVVLQALLGRNFQADPRHEGLVETIALLATHPPPDDGPPDALAAVLTASLQDVPEAPAIDELWGVRVALGAAPPPRRPPWRPPEGPW